MKRRGMIYGGLGLAFAAALYGLSQPSEEASREHGQGAVTIYDGQDDDTSLKERIDAMSADKPVFVMYYATWCGYCAHLTETLQQLAQESDVPFAVLKVDVEKHTALARQNKQTTGVPEVFIYYKGEGQSHFVGDMPKDVLNQFLSEFSAQVMKAPPQAKPAP